MTYTSTNRTITDGTFTLASVNKIEQFYDANGNRYFGLVSAYVSATSAVLALGGTLPSSAMTIFTLTEIDPSIPATGRYCSQADLEMRIGKLHLAEITNETANATVSDPLVVDQMIERSGATIDHVLSGVYDVPLVPTPSKIKAVCIDLACYAVMLKMFSVAEVPAQWIETNKRALKDLEDISTLDNALDAQYLITAQSAKIVSQTKVVDFTDSTNKFSFF